MVKWGPDKDAVLLAGILEFTRVPMSPGLLEHLAKKIGEGCTPKAIHRRLDAIKRTAKDRATGSTPSAPATPKKGAGTPGTKTSSATGKCGRATPKSAAKGAGDGAVYADANGFFADTGFHADHDDGYDDEVEQFLDAKRVKYEVVKKEEEEGGEDEKDSVYAGGSRYELQTAYD